MANSLPMVALGSLDEQRQGLRVEFHWCEDRYAHMLYRVDGDIAVPFLSSLEGTADELFPTSPCLFDLHQQDQVLFLTGATSTCHFSMSVQAKHPTSLEFEVACRLKTQPPWLGSTYKILHPEAKKALRSDSNLCGCETTQQISISPARASAQVFPTTLQWTYTAEA